MYIGRDSFFLNAFYPQKGDKGCTPCPLLIHFGKIYINFIKDFKDQGFGNSYLDVFLNIWKTKSEFSLD